jgi:Domain of unknown function (DUF5655)/Domain of unknown function (DUF4287)
MATAEEGIQSQIRNIEATYGRPLKVWFDVIVASGRTKHSEIVAMLKADHGMTHGAAHRVSLQARQAAAPPVAADTDPADTLYLGAKAGLRPIHVALMEAIGTFGDDVEVAGKKGYLSLRRRRQFAMIQPSTSSRIDVGLVLRDEPARDRLESAAGFNALFTHRVRVANVREVDAQLRSWLYEAYQAAG